MDADRADSLLRANRELARFTHRVGHDLRAPLRTLGAFAQIIAARLSGSASVEADARLAEALAFVAEAGETLSELVEDLVLHATVLVEEHRPKPVDTGALLARLARRFEDDAGSPSLWLEGEKPPRVLGSETQLARLFALLAEQGVRDAGAGAGVRVSAFRAGPRCEFRIRCVSAEGDPAGLRAASPRDPLHRGEFESPPELRFELCTRIVQVHGGVLREEAPKRGGVCYVLDLPVA